jgi:hypothetical protein
MMGRRELRPLLQQCADKLHQQLDHHYHQPRFTAEKCKETQITPAICVGGAYKYLITCIVFEYIKHFYE